MTCLHLQRMFQTDRECSDNKILGFCVLKMYTVSRPSSTGYGKTASTPYKKRLFYFLWKDSFSFWSLELSEAEWIMARPWACFTGKTSTCGPIRYLPQFQRWWCCRACNRWAQLARMPSQRINDHLSQRSQPGRWWRSGRGTDRGINVSTHPWEQPVEFRARLTAGRQSADTSPLGDPAPSPPLGNLYRGNSDSRQRHGYNGPQAPNLSFHN